MATGTIILPVQSAKISGAYVATSPQIQGGDGAWKLLYDASGEEEALWQFRLPVNYSTTPLMKLPYAMTSGTTGGVAWNVEIMALTAGNNELIGTSSFDAVNVGSGTVATTAGGVTEISVTLNTVDSMLARLKYPTVHSKIVRIVHISAMGIHLTA